MSWLADAHRDWHTVHGWDKVCDLDCGVGEVYDYDEDDMQPWGVKCGHCKLYHADTHAVYLCSRMSAGFYRLGTGPVV